MIEDIIGVFTLALIIGILAVAIKNGSQTSSVINNTLGGFANIEKTALAG